MQLEGGRKYAVKIEYTQNGAGGGAEFNWIPPSAVTIAEAEKVVKDSDVALVFVGLNGSQEGEGHDRSTIDLPEPQESLVKAVIATGKPVVVVLTSGSAVAVNTAAAGATAVLCGLVRRRGSRHGHRRYAGGRQQSGGPPPMSRSTRAWTSCRSSPTTP